MIVICYYYHFVCRPILVTPISKKSTNGNQVILVNPLSVMVREKDYYIIISIFFIRILVEGLFMNREEK